MCGLLGQEKEFWELEVFEKLELVVKKKEDGNVFFKVGNYVWVFKRYEKVRVFCIVS